MIATPSSGAVLRIRVIAPSGPVPADRLNKGLRTLTAHVAPGAHVEVSAQVRQRWGYFAGPDNTRRAAIEAAFNDGEADIIWCARGGYGASRLLDGLDGAGLDHGGKLLVGFSDVTALLAWAWSRCEIVGLHGPVLTQLGGLHPADVEQVSAWIRGDVPPPAAADEGTVVRGGTVEGRMLGGNLEVLRSLLGTKYWPSLAGCVLALEEVGERPYRIDRALTQLISSGALRGVAAIVIGQLTACGEPHYESDSPTAADVVLERLEPLGVPVVTGFGFGHDPTRHFAWPYGGRVRLRADDATLEFLEPVR
ncbi:MAG: LD-carboxypeptidase [Myxococcales bacterium FL481]|nr:MAG: LD-carboxypeptidase [Myxococcales bacterium FL481]